MSCTDNEDGDFDGLVDCADPDCEQDPACTGVQQEVCTDSADNDGDTFTDCDDDACFDAATCYDVDDGTDLTTPDGDPSVDIDKVGATLTNGTGTLFVTTDGTWPPPAGTYSYFVELNFNAANGSRVAGATVQQHAGADSTIPFGVPAGNITVRQSAAGVFVRMTGVPATATQFSVTSGIQKTNPGTRVTDDVAATPLVQRVEKPEYTAEVAALGARISPLAVPATANANLADTQGLYGYRCEVPPGDTIRVCVSSSASAGVNYYPQYSPGYTFVDGQPGCTDLTNLDAVNQNYVLVKVDGAGSPNNITVTTSAP